ncbi:MAG: hypothetical protein HeimC3_52400 [Candidatus Heimdallarchaeota archaeon LC_3]|nr:MAG: hypothetical protein HeimC3_52400 [Candidatus Heimdallarchaeota archaeon LC_3]
MNAKKKDHLVFKPTKFKDIYNYKDGFYSQYYDEGYLKTIIDSILKEFLLFPLHFLNSIFDYLYQICEPNFRVMKIQV